MIDALDKKWVEVGPAERAAVVLAQARSDAARRPSAPVFTAELNYSPWSISGVTWLMNGKESATST